VVVEQSANRILTLQNSAMEELFGITFMLFVGTVVILLLFATLLTRRIGQLRNRVEAAVTPDGRIQGSLKADQRRDEIGDLNRSFSGVLDRLAEYNRYLESMASRLAHELRTPLTIVKSSLENLQSESNEQQREQYIHRALDGSERLGLILHRMREATRLEQLLQSAEFERFDLKALAQAAAEGYRTAFPGVEFELSLPDQAAMVRAAPELVGQALDKLVSNAVDFHTPGTPIRIILHLTAPNRLWFAIRNSGPTLPKDMEQELFNSMVSVRKDRGSEPHLGLGLYLVRLIAEFHRGKATAGNLKDNSGVEFGINLPMES
jgi:two-component system sensor histidine kinase ChvG